MRKPFATYRLQLHAGFGFDDASAIADYLQALGVSHVYSSPYLQAMPGSKHGYDVADHHRVNEELGGAEAHARFSLRLGECKLGQVLDIVPNHMAIGGRLNQWWWDVLENGPASRYASYFDIDWQSPEERLRNKVLLPILGDHYGRVLKAGEIKIVRNGAEAIAKFYEHELPIAPESLAPLLGRAAWKSGSDALGFLADSLRRLPTFESVQSDREGLFARHRDKNVIRGWLGRLLAERAPIARYVDDEIQAVNGNVDALDELLERQNYRVAFWKTASRDLGYRRFFDINTLVGMHMEDRLVFDDTHSLIIEWLKAGVLDGVRVDHPDGLRDPREYFRRLRTAASEDSWIVAEKILEPGEELPPEWQVEGTTGYDFLNILNGLMVDHSAEGAFSDFYARFAGEMRSFEEVAYKSKLLVLRDILGSDVNRLTASFQEICELNRDHRDYTRHDIHHALRELVASFPIYRTYVRAKAGQVSQTDVEYINQATATAKQRRPDIDTGLFDLLHEVLLLRVPGERESEFVMRFQQFTGPAMAKGVEDTAFYAYNRFAVLNEVGGDPGRFGVSIEEFHAYCASRQQHWPLTQLAGSTHDTKRSEDVRARLAVLSEAPELWVDAVWRWSVHNEKHRRNSFPDRNTEYLVYQTLFGAWPIGFDRLMPYMEKASREAKQQTTWTTPNEEFEAGLRRFVECILDDSEFLTDFKEFSNRFVGPGRVNSLAQTLIRLTAPGVPDIYQGTELWDLSLVDPDNRRPVDYAARRKVLADLNTLTPEQILLHSDEGHPKMWVIKQSLLARKQFPDSLGREGGYSPLVATGQRREHVVAFQRGNDVITIAPRLAFKLGGDWLDTAIALPAGNWKNVLTGDAIQAGDVKPADLFARFPVVLLTLAAEAQ